MFVVLLFQVNSIQFKLKSRSKNSVKGNNEVTTTVETSTTFTNNSLGYYAPANAHNSFRGNMADFRFYNTVLTAAEIAAVYNGTG